MSVTPVTPSRRRREPPDALNVPLASYRGSRRMLMIGIIARFSPEPGIASGLAPQHGGYTTSG